MSTSFVSLSAIFIWFFFDFLPTSWIFFSLCHWEFNLEIQFFSNNFSLLFNKNCLPFYFHFPEVEYSSTSLELRISSEIFITDEVLFYFQYMNISQWRPQFKQQSTVPSIGSGFFFMKIRIFYVGLFQISSLAESRFAIIIFLFFFFFLNFRGISALIECLVLPLQDKLEEWKKFTVNLDKEHSKGKNKHGNIFLTLTSTN